MNPAALVAIAVLVVLVMQQRRHAGPVRNPYNPRRRRRPGPGQLELPEAPSAYPVYHVAGGGKLPNKKKQPYWVFAQWAGVSSSDARWFTHDPVGRNFSSYAEAADVARDLARRTGGVVTDSREERRRLLNRNPVRRRFSRYNPRRARACGCGSGTPCLENPSGYQAACRIGPGHVWDFRYGGRCECCGRAAPKRLVTLEWDAGGHTNYGRTCAGRAIGTTKLRTNQLEHMDRAAGHRAAREQHYRGAGGRSGVVRPPFARGWSEADIVELARRVGESPFDRGWWLTQTANLVPGRYVLTPQGRRYVPPTVEFRRFVSEGGQRGHKRQRGGGAARSARPARARAAVTSGRPGDDLPW